MRHSVAIIFTIIATTHAVIASNADIVLNHVQRPIEIVHEMSQPGPCDPQGADPWEDRRSISDSGRREVIREAWQELKSVGLTQFADRLVIKLDYDPNYAQCRYTRAGCNKRKVNKYEVKSYEDSVYYVPKTGQFVILPRPASNITKELECRLFITSCVFEKAWVNMDEDGEVFWDDDPDVTNTDSGNLYYKYALNLVEAVEFILLHEIAHIEYQSGDQCNDYARKMILELRKHKTGRRANFDPLGFKELYSGFVDEFGDHCCILGGPPPTRTK